jgi:recyclin-1
MSTPDRDNSQALYIDRTDFLNAAVREKKKFENSLDNSVAVGLNAGTELLMQQVCLYHLVDLILMET